jgi:hypothetical protein
MLIWMPSASRHSQTALSVWPLSRAALISGQSIRSWAALVRGFFSPRAARRSRAAEVDIFWLVRWAIAFDSVRQTSAGFNNSRRNSPILSKVQPIRQYSAIFGSQGQRIHPTNTWEATPELVVEHKGAGCRHLVLGSLPFGLLDFARVAIFDRRIPLGMHPFWSLFLAADDVPKHCWEALST